jgi:hypothetical protein
MVAFARRFILLCLFIANTPVLFAQLATKPKFSGLYLQWGYNRDWYSRSTIRFWEGSNYDFTLHKVTASDRPDFEAFRTTPLDLTIPQNSFRMGMYLNEKHTHAIEINFDHAKYVVDVNQKAHMTGHMGGEYMDTDTILVPHFVDFEHSNGANFLLLNYVGQYELAHTAKRPLASCVWKLGAGIVIPRSDVRINAVRRDNVYHIAGYIVGTEAGLRCYPLKNLFLEATAKGGFANFLDVLTIDSGKARHHFWYAEVIGLVGYEINNFRWIRGRKAKHR